MSKNESDVDLVVKFNKTLSTEQKNMLIEIARLCEGLGALKSQLAPLFAAVFIGQPHEITENDIRIAQSFAENPVVQRVVEEKLGRELEKKASQKLN